MEQFKRKKKNVLNKTYEDSSDSSNDNISDNCDSNEEDFPSEQADDQNIQNHRLNLEHMLMTSKLLIKLHRNHYQILKTQLFNMVKFQNLELRFSISYQMKMK